MLLRLSFVIGFLLCLTACSTSSPYSRTPAPIVSGVAEQAKTSTTTYYHVQRGDTLYAIAWRFGLDYQRLAKLNQLSEPYPLSVGQTLRLKSTVPLKTNVHTKSSKRQIQPATTRRTSKQPSHSGIHRVQSKTQSTRLTRWRWPAKGPVINGFNPKTNKGIDIAGRRGQRVVASQPGRVVYAGTGLQGYGRLIIVKHNNHYLSAYAHNHKLFVKEGETVRAGQKIAEMGSSDANRVELHFEIRKDGSPVDPRRYLPKA